MRTSSELFSWWHESPVSEIRGLGLCLCQLSEALPGPNKFWWLQLRTSIPDVAEDLLVQKTKIAATYCRRPGLDSGVMSRVLRPLECRSVTCIAYFVCETSAGRGRGVSANGTVRYRCLAQDEPADQRHSGRVWTPDGTSYFSVGGGCRLLPRESAVECEVATALGGGC